MLGTSECGALSTRPAERDAALDRILIMGLSACEIFIPGRSLNREQLKSYSRYLEPDLKLIFEAFSPDVYSLV